MLMAAGLGTRLRPFTDLESKAFLPLMGVPMAQFAVDALVHAGVARIVVNVHHHAERARAGIEALDFGGAEFIISDESRKLLGSAGGLRHVAGHFGEQPFFLLNADTLCEVDFAALARAHARLRARWGVWITLAVFPRGPVGGRYRELSVDPQSGLIVSLGEPEEGKPFFAGAAVIEPEVLVRVPDGEPSEFVQEILLPAIRHGKAGAFLASGQWQDVGSSALWLEAHLRLIEGLETGQLSTAWRRRVEKTSRRAASGVWVSRDASARVSRIEYSGPCYWSPLGGARISGAIGPRAAIYGKPRLDSRSNGIGYNGVWVDVK